MGKKHILFYDLILPLAGILLIGGLLSRRFAGVILHRVDAIKAFGLGYWFVHSGLRVTLLDYSWLAFALIPAAGWAVWVRLNLELDIARGRVRLDRPLFTFFRWLLDRITIRKRGLPAHTAAAVGTGEEWPDDVMPPLRRQG